MPKPWPNRRNMENLAIKQEGGTGVMFPVPFCLVRPAWAGLGVKVPNGTYGGVRGRG